MAVAAVERGIAVSHDSQLDELRTAKAPARQADSAMRGAYDHRKAEKSEEDGDDGDDDDDDDAGDDDDPDAAADKTAATSARLLSNPTATLSTAITAAAPAAAWPRRSGLRTAHRTEAVEEMVPKRGC